ncbi:Crp/Fnr family transcriptional regulator [Dinghuibacter silviterrae]|uniref:CRP-like cAMP-binding protein n=1 Tax=Dinghuibacter silviterrae TaxID=1539049 RepID=A0A4R8DQF7_9BACT|nr:Crp/Fnr family transcriptional regulator [Dinghuibacter silviterrae]TDX00374.1 CRP-like cAMP-binding protein [Dinghuibacter silviterrae]
MSKDAIKTFIRDTLSISRLSISGERLDEIVSLYEPHSFARNDLFIKEGKIATHHYFLTNGFMRAFTHNLDGEEVTTDFFHSNIPVGEPTSLFTGAKAMENIQALTDCEGFLISFEHSNRLFHTIPEFREFGRTMLVKDFAAFKKRTLSLINQTAEERYADLINTNKEVFQYAQLKYIASYLGITDSSLSRIRKEYSKK